MSLAEEDGFDPNTMHNFDCRPPHLGKMLHDEKGPGASQVTMGYATNLPPFSIS